MENYKKIVKTAVKTINNSGKTFRDIFNVMFSHKDKVAYEILDSNYQIKKVSYEKLKIEIDKFAGFLKHKYPNVKDEYIGIDLNTGPEFLIAFWAVLQSGNKSYLINSYYPDKLGIDLLKRLNVKIVITKAEYKDFITLNPDDIKDDFKSENDSKDWGNEFAISSSLTGLEAKICVYDGASVVNQINNTVNIINKNKWFLLDYKHNIKILALLPFFHIFGLVVSCFWLAFFGRTIVFLQNFSQDTIKNTINMHKVTHIFAPPVLYHKLYKSIINGVSQESEKKKKKFNFWLKITYAFQNIFPRLGVIISRKIFKEIIEKSFGKSVQFMITGGAFINKDALRLINNIGYPLFNGYGTTETSISGVESRKKIKHRISGSIGDSFQSVEYSVLEDQTLKISGSSICKEIISFDKIQSGFDSIETNDIVKKIDGRYYIEGRKSDLFIGENGENISPDVIQNELKIKRALNFSVLDLNGKLSLVLEYDNFIPDLIISKEVGKIKLDLQSINYGFAVREIFITRDKIANDNSIKVSRALLKKLINDGEVKLQKSGDIKVLEEDADGSINDNSVIALIKGLFNKSLDTNTDIDIDANFFFDLGGNSLDYFTMIKDLSAMFDVQINLEQKNNLYTIKDIYKYLKDSGIL